MLIADGLPGQCIVGRTPKGWRLFLRLPADADVKRATGKAAIDTGDGCKIELLTKGGALVAGRIDYGPDGKATRRRTDPVAFSGFYSTLRGGDLRVDDLAVVPVALLDRLREALESGGAVTHTSRAGARPAPRSGRP